MATLPPLDEQVIPELIERLQAPEASRRLRAAAALGRFGALAAEAVPALVDALHDEDAHVRKMAALALGDIGPSAGPAVPALVRALRDPEPGVRRRAALALGEMNCLVALPALQQMAAQDSAETVRRAAQRVLGLLGGEKVARAA
jgi:HEAT repeat protein